MSDFFKPLLISSGPNRNICFMDKHLMQQPCDGYCYVDWYWVVIEDRIMFYVPGGKFTEDAVPQANINLEVAQYRKRTLCHEAKIEKINLVFVGNLRKKFKNAIIVHG